MPISTQIGCGNIQVAVSIRAYSESSSPDLEKTGADGDEPNYGSQAAKILLGVLGSLKERKRFADHRGRVAPPFNAGPDIRLLRPNKLLQSWCLYTHPPL